MAANPAPAMVSKSTKNTMPPDVICPSDEYNVCCLEQLRIQGSWVFEFDLPSRLGMIMIVDKLERFCLQFL